MNRKSIAQEYFALAVDKNGNMPPMRRDESYGGLVIAGLMDLLLYGIIVMEKKKITVIGDLPQELAHIESLYNYLKQKMRRIEKIMVDYCTGKRIRQLLKDTGESLLKGGMAFAGTGGIFVPGTTYIPEREYKDKLTGVIKSALTAEDEITPHDVVLIAILQESKNLNQYFSKHERAEVKAKLKKIKENPQNRQLVQMVNFVEYISDLIFVLIICYIIFFI